MSFNYLIDKIHASSIDQLPFAHIQINNFFNEAHFSQITAAPEIVLHQARSDEELFEMLFKAGWKIISFPGCITDHKTYIKWHKDKDKNQTLNNSACEGFGITLRLVSPSAPILLELSDFMASEPFKQVMADKFKIRLEDVVYDGGIQKYLDGYEISPHPDIRRKALTYMVNVNPGAGSEKQEHHTHYLVFKDAYKYVEAYWNGHPGEDRCWVPWDWCESKKEQRENNSMVIFSPGNNTMHGVKATYDHWSYQRTQLYGNLWYSNKQTMPVAEWEDLDIRPGLRRASKTPSLQDQLRAVLPAPVKEAIKKVLGRTEGNAVVAARKTSSDASTNGY